MLSLVIPTLNAAESLVKTLTSVKGVQTVVCDGGSEDNTCDLARSMDARVIQAAPGRGGQMAEGAQAADGDWLLFLHADTTLEEGWRQEVDAFMSAPDATAKAAYFQLAFDSSDKGAKSIARAANWRARALGLPYGDQGLLISRRFYDALGGFQALPLMEDVDMVRRIGRGRLLGLKSKAVTSAARYRRDGYWRRPLRNLSCLALYLLGLPIRLIVKLYG